MGPWMQVASSASSTSSPSFAPSHAQRMAYPKSDININLRDHFASKVYTSLDPVDGDLTITTKRDVRFDSIQILLLGHTRTVSEGMGMPQEMVHTFLKMVMPIPESTYPTPRVLEPGHTFTIPFHFVIPSQLTINACNHARLSEAMQDHHVKLPPSLGGWQRDDMAPNMTRVEYTVKARVVREDGDRKTRIMEATQTIHVLPATPEDPPLSITDKDRLYRMSKTKTVRKNILTSRLGRITAEALQPGAAILSPDGRRVMSHPMARVRLSLETESPRALPPTITGVAAKLTAHTYFSSGTIASFPNLGEWNVPYAAERRGTFSTSVALPSVALAEQPAWTPSPALARRDSGYGSTGGRSSSESSDHEAAAAAAAAGRLYHTTTISVPLSLPTDKKTFVPTFHSCIASRVYTVQLTVALATKGAGTTSVSLVVPLQVAVDGAASAAAASSSPSRAGGQGAQGAGEEGAAGPDGPPSFEEAAADEHLRPRVLHVPEEDVAREGRASWLLTAGEAAQAADRGELPEYGEPGWRRRVD